MNTFTIILFGLVILLYLKWILIILVFPFQVIHGQILKKWGNSKNTPILYKVLDKPYHSWEKIFRKGWQRYMLFQIGLVPSLHLRRFVYKALGAEIGKNVVFHFFGILLRSNASVLKRLPNHVINNILLFF